MIRFSAGTSNRFGLVVPVLFAFVVLVMSAAETTAQVKPDTKRLDVSPIKVTAHQLGNFDKIDIGRRKFGELEWIGGVKLTSPSAQFGGWSGLALDADGRGFVAVSDAGAWMSGELTYDGKARPSGMANVRVGPLKALNKKTLRRNRDRDAEAVVLVSGTSRRGRLLIGFEQNHRIGRFNVGPDGLSAPLSYVRPEKRRGRMKALKGFEAVAVLKGGPYRGSIVAISERHHDKGKNHTGWIWVKGKARSFTLTDIGGFDITDAVALPDGGLLLLERRFRWLEGVKMRVRHLPAAEIRVGKKLSGRVLMEANMGQEIDNMEGIAVHGNARDGFILTLISDDNFNRVLQRTVLLQFRWRRNLTRDARVR